MSKLKMIEEMCKSYEMKLKETGGDSVKGLLEIRSSKEGRGDLGDKIVITEKLILKWANYADLARIKGIDGKYAELLEAVGVDTVLELGKRKPEHLFAKMLEVNETKRLVRKMPEQKQVEEWVQQAANIPHSLKY